MEKFLTADQIKSWIPVRKKDSHKGSYGKILVVGGSKRFTGAPCICASSCMRAGSGLVTLAVEPEVFPVVAAKLEEVMVLDLSSYPEEYNNLLSSVDCIAFGCGMGIRDYTVRQLQHILSSSTCPLVIDADGLNVVAKHPDFLNGPRPIILTPHEGEFSRLCNVEVDIIRRNKTELAKTYARSHGIILIVKGSTTVITDGTATYLSEEGVPEMATGGMGDCLTGIIASLIGQKLPLLEACSLAVYLHSYTARQLSESMYSVLASDVYQNLPFVLKELSLSMNK